MYLFNERKFYWRDSTRVKVGVQTASTKTESLNDDADEVLSSQHERNIAAIYLKCSTKAFRFIQKLQSNTRKYTGVRLFVCNEFGKIAAEEIYCDMTRCIQA